MSFITVSSGIGGVEIATPINMNKCVTHDQSHSGSEFTIPNVPSKPIAIVYSYTTGGAFYTFVTTCDGSGSLKMNDLSPFGSLVKSYDEDTKDLVLATASSSSIAYKIAVFY